MFINRHTPYKFKNGQTMKNRIIVPPMASQTADESGFVTERTTENYRRLGRSNAGLIFVEEYSFIHITGKGEANQLGADSDVKVPGLKQIAATLHQSSAMAGLQLVHVGGTTSTDLTGAPLMGPSAIAVPVKGWEPETPMPMTEEQIQNWTEWFVEAAGRAVAADFDFVELHAAHGYGLNQWLSPLTNKRTDSFGGTIEGRSRLLLRIAAKIKATYPNVLLSVRLPAQDHLDGGLSVDEMAWVDSQLESIGVDLLDVSSGIGGWRRPEGKSGQGYLVADAAQLKAQTAVPVMGVGGIETGEFIDEILDAAQVDFAAVGRAILQDPEGWSRKNLTARHGLPPSWTKFLKVKYITIKKGVTMKFIIPILSAFAVVASTAAVRAEAANSQFTCTYKPGNRPDVSAQTITYQAPEGVDLAHPNAGGPFEPETISLYVNGSSEPSTFNVKKTTTSFSHEVVYWQRGQFFINDIAIRYYKDANGNTSFKGTWIVDYPPVIEMDCKFGTNPQLISLGYRRYVIVDGVCWDDKAGIDVPMSYCKRN